MNEKQALAKLDATYSKVSSKRAVSGQTICETYKQIKPSLAAIMFLVSAIPGIGKKIALILEIVIAAADAGCGGKAPF